MQRIQFRSKLWSLCFLLSGGLALGDGMVFSEVYNAKVEIPNQQALIHYSGGIERLVIETSFLAEGTNFAWVVPLPSAPEVKAVSESFFTHVQEAFRAELVHRVNPYYAGVLLVCGLAFLGSRALKDEVLWLADLPLCLLLGVGAGLIGRHVAFGLVALILALCIRLFARSPATYALILLIGTFYAAILTFVPNAHGPHLFNTMDRAGSDSLTERTAGVTVVSVQHAGLFETTTIRGNSPSAVLQWLERNGYHAPESAEPAIRQYVDRGWVFVASKAHLGPAESHLVALHPLAFTFPSGAQVYPTILTAIGNHDCAIALYVFGDRRATARHFSAVRCDRMSKLPISDPEILALIGDSTFGTKLVAKMSPAQMASDVDVRSSFAWSKGRRVYSYSGAFMIALNLALPLAVLGWLFAGMSQGGWKVSQRWISKWRWRSIAVAGVFGLAIFIVLPKVEVEMVIAPPVEEQDAARGFIQPHRRAAYGNHLPVCLGRSQDDIPQSSTGCEGSFAQFPVVSNDDPR